MINKIVRFSLVIVTIFSSLLLLMVKQVQADNSAQQPTVSIATVTGTPSGPFITVNLDQEQINVRSGPGTDYEKVGVLVAGQVAPANGKSSAGLWIQIVYPGVAEGVAWVYSPLVTLTRGGELPILEPPPTSTPLVTPTVDPTLAAQLVEEIPPTRLPTFTSPAEPLEIPTFESNTPFLSNANFPMGIIIIIFMVLGLLGALIALVRGR
jgi:hypothetical protein